MGITQSIPTCSGVLNFTDGVLVSVTPNDAVAPADNASACTLCGKAFNLGLAAGPVWYDPTNGFYISNVTNGPIPVVP